jgi:hypothetical protein
MLKIEIINTKKVIKIKDFEEDIDFFYNFFKKIDDEKIAIFYYGFDDFEFDFLSIFDFLKNLVFFINSNDSEKEFILLLYERGSDKIIFNKKNNNFNVSLIKDDECNDYTYSQKELNFLIFKLVDNLDAINTIFKISELNKTHFDLWKKNIVSVLVL